MDTSRRLSAVGAGSHTNSTNNSRPDRCYRNNIAGGGLNTDEESSTGEESSTEEESGTEEDSNTDRETQMAVDSMDSRERTTDVDMDGRTRSPSIVILEVRARPPTINEDAMSTAPAARRSPTIIDVDWREPTIDVDALDDPPVNIDDRRRSRSVVPSAGRSPSLSLSELLTGSPRRDPPLSPAWPSTPLALPRPHPPPSPAWPSTPPASPPYCPTSPPHTYHNRLRSPVSTSTIPTVIESQTLSSVEPDVQPEPSNDRLVPTQSNNVARIPRKTGDWYSVVRRYLWMDRKLIAVEILQ